MSESNRRPIQDVIEQSSLGTPAAQRARRSIPAQRGQAVANRAATYAANRSKNAGGQRKTE